MTGPKKKVNIHPPKQGTERVNQIIADATDKDTLLPKAISFSDLDRGFVEFVRNELKMDLNGEEVPVFFLGNLKRYMELTRTWPFVNEDKNLEMPFVTITRRPDVQVGTHPSSQYRPPVERLFNYRKVPVWDGNKKGVDLYKIPRPVYVDLSFEVRLFTEKLSEINRFSKVVLKKFSSIQAYIKHKGHYFPVTLEGVDDETEYGDFEQRRYYVQVYKMILSGYTLNEKKFSVERATLLKIEIDTTVPGAVKKVPLEEIYATVHENLFRLYINWREQTSLLAEDADADPIPFDPDQLITPPDFTAQYLQIKEQLNTLLNG